MNINNRWLVDANRFSHPEQITSNFELQPPEIRNYLDSYKDNCQIVIGAKGSGKTFLLSAKRIQYIQKKIRCLPQERFLYNFIGYPIFNKWMVYHFKDPSNWSIVFGIAIVLSVLNKLDVSIPELKSQQLTSLKNKHFSHDVSSNFTQLLHIISHSRKAFFELNIDYSSVLIPAFCKIHSPIAIFIDGIDHYFSNHLAADATGETSPEIWASSQLGLADAAYRLSETNHHVKVFTSLRIEALHANKISPRFLSNSLILKYSRESLMNIFINNIKVCSHDAVINPELLETDPILAFLGSSTLHNAFCNSEESVANFIYRHTYQLPRDIISIGKAISNILPLDRSEERIKRAIVNCAEIQTQNYLKILSQIYTEVDVFKAVSLIRLSVLNRNELRRICCEYSGKTFDEIQRTCRECNSPNIFLFLYGAGLLGIIQDDSEQKIQRFLSPNYNAPVTNGELPNSTHYIIHPALYPRLFKESKDFSLNTKNIVGYDLPWTEDANPIKTKVKKRIFSGLPYDGPIYKLELHEILTELVCEHYTFEEDEPPADSAKFRHDILLALGKVFGEDEVKIIDLGCGKGPMVTALNSLDPKQLGSLTYYGINYGGTKDVGELIKRTKFKDKVRKCWLYSFEDIENLRIPSDFIIIIDLLHHLNPFSLNILLKFATENIKLNKSIFIVETEKHRELNTFLWRENDLELLFDGYDFLRCYSGKSIITLSGVDTETTIADVKRIDEGNFGDEFIERTLSIYLNKKIEIRKRIKEIESKSDLTVEELEELSRLILVERKIVIDIEEAQEYLKKR